MKAALVTLLLSVLVATVSAQTTTTGTTPFQDALNSDAGKIVAYILGALRPLSAKVSRPPRTRGVVDVPFFCPFFRLRPGLGLALRRRCH
jgi:hypothetical protein